MLNPKHLYMQMIRCLVHLVKIKDCVKPYSSQYLLPQFYYILCSDLRISKSVCIFSDILLWLLENKTYDLGSILVRQRENLTTEQILHFQCCVVPMENL